MKYFQLPLELRVSIRGIALSESGRPMQDTELRPGDTITVVYQGDSQVHISADRGKTGLWFKVEPDEGLDHELRNSLRRTNFRIVSWPWPNSDVTKVFETTKLLSWLFPDLHIAGQTQLGHSNRHSTFLVKGVEHITQAA